MTGVGGRGGGGCAGEGGGGGGWGTEKDCCFSKSKVRNISTLTFSPFC